MERNLQRRRMVNAASADHIPVARRVMHSPATEAAPNDTSQSDTCKSGYVWREATAGDRVCERPSVRTQAWNDNAQAADRR
ncbi:hypothetical protein PUR26_00415, partial [Streptomyces sp. SP18CS02]|nr:hypothetical protein [Streptomyces sp. SP18CS02]